MNQFLLAMKAKLVADFNLFVGYWYIWVGFAGILTGIWLYLRYRRSNDADAD